MKLRIQSKAYILTFKDDYEGAPMHIHGETLFDGRHEVDGRVKYKYGAKARAVYAFYLSCDFEDFSYIDYLKAIDVRRDPANDLIYSEISEEVSALSQAELSILIHANGNANSYPLKRQRFYTSITSDPMLRLVELKYMSGPKGGWDEGMGYFNITDEGARIASSLLPIPRSRMEKVK